MDYINTKQEKYIVRRNRRLYVPGGVYFITSVTWQRKPLFKEDVMVEMLRQTLRNAKQLHPFTMQAYIFLPDHSHIMLRPDLPMTISQIMHSFKRNFTWNYKKAKEIPRSTSVRLWQYGSWDHVIRDGIDQAKHFDYHYNAVKHGYAAKPEDFPHSSYMTYVRKGWYEIGWGHIEPENLRDLDFE
jgi:putative transposase